MGALHELAIFTGIATPQEWKVPKGTQPYLVTARNDQGDTHVFATFTEANEPNQLREVIFTVYPDTVDYTFQPTTRETIHEVGRQRVKEHSTRQLIGTFLLMQERGI
jgi:hypothetical protein